jgi:hypothetical protein
MRRKNAKKRGLTREARKHGEALDGIGYHDGTKPRRKTAKGDAPSG